MFLKMESRGGMEINSRPPPRLWQLMLHCQAKGKAAKGLVTSQHPMDPTASTMRKEDEKKSESRYLRVSTAIRCHWVSNQIKVRKR
jgi:hypothetical protein